MAGLGGANARPRARWKSERREIAPGAGVFVGLFPGAIPQCAPVAGTLLAEAPGAHLFGPVPDGVYQIMAAALPGSEDPLDSLLPGDRLRVGRGAPVLVRRGVAPGESSIRMRPLLALGPPG